MTDLIEATPADVLVWIAKFNKVRVSETMELDANVHEPFTSKTKLRIGSRTVEILASRAYLKLTLPGVFGNDVISINRPDGIFMTLDAHRVVKSTNFSVFARSMQPRRVAAPGQNEKRLSKSIDAASFLKDLIKCDEDSVHFYANGIVAYRFGSITPRMANESITALIELAKLTEDREGQEEVNLPSRFADLQKIALRWAISDDERRSDAIRDASKTNIRRLVKAVRPRINEITKYLNDRPDDADTAAPLDAIVQAALEAQQLRNI